MGRSLLVAVSRSLCVDCCGLFTLGWPLKLVAVGQSLRFGCSRSVAVGQLPQRLAPLLRALWVGHYVNWFLWVGRCRLVAVVGRCGWSLWVGRCGLVTVGWSLWVVRCGLVAVG